CLSPAENPKSSAPAPAVIPRRFTRRMASGWLGACKSAPVSDRFRLVVYDRGSGQITNLTEGFDQWVESYAWSPDSKFIYFASEKEGASPIYRLNLPVALAGNKPTGTGVRAIEQVLNGTNDEPNISSDGKTLVFTQLSVTSPTE